MTTSESERTGWSRSRGVTVLLLCVGGLFVGGIVGQVFTAAAASWAGYHGSLVTLSNLAEPPWWLIVSGLLGVWIGFGTTVAVVQHRFHAIAPGAFAPRWSDVGYLALGVGLQIVVGVAYLPFHLKNLSGPTHRLLGSASGWEFAALCVGTAVVAPVIEELFFRGVLFPALRSLFATRSARITLTLAVVVDGVLFALAHFELLQLPGLAFVGAVLAYVYWRTQRLIPSMLVHASFNTVVVITLISQRAH